MLRKKKIVIVFIGLFLLVGIFLWYGNRVAQERERERELLLKAAYASYMEFSVSDRSSMTGSVIAEFQSNRRNPEEVQYTEIVLVHSSDEAIYFGEYVLVAWPRDNVYVDGRANPIRGTQWVLDALNEIFLERVPDIDFRDYGLPENEITIIDVVDSWEIVESLIRQYIPQPDSYMMMFTR